jgi:uncharacterized membrane protein
VTDVLASQLPTELIAPYTALTAALVGASTPTDQLASWRWVAFILLLVAIPIATWISKEQKSGTWTFPWLATLAAEVAAVAWAFLMPGSPLVPYLHSEHARTLVPLCIAVGGTVVASVTAALLTTTPGQLSLSDILKKVR